ncbi:MAG TPA: hypothetical protein VFG29_03530 [Syntrophales bacterium]|nr:hypothetical protein [Syntrophales bacterium]
MLESRKKRLKPSTIRCEKVQAAQHTLDALEQMKEQTLKGGRY